MAGVLGNLFFAKPGTLPATAISDETIPGGAYLFSAAQSDGLMSASGVLFVAGTTTGTQVRILVSHNKLAYKRRGFNWFVVTATEMSGA